MTRITAWLVFLIAIGPQLPDAVGDQVEVSQAAGSGAIEEVIVTGSRIPRRDAFSVSPIVTLDRAEIELSGALEVKQVLNTLPQVDPAVGAGTGNNFGGESFVNLRALGANRTLVLLNGRRYPSQGMSGSINLDALPPALIDRVEVITGGASAVYGSDAMAGAVNFLLRNDFDGFEANAQFDVTDHGDGEKYNVDLAFGKPIAGGRGHLILFGDYYKRTQIFQDARSFSRTQFISDDIAGELLAFGSFASDAASIAGVGPFYTFERDGTPRFYVEPDDRFNLSPYNSLLAPTERYSASAFGEYQSSDVVRSRFEVSLTQSRPTQMAADEFFDFVDINVDRPDLTPEFRQILANDADPDGDGIASIFLARTFSPERGPATVVHESDFWRILIGLDGAVGNDWNWHVDTSYAENARNSHSPNDISIGRLRQGLLVDPLTGQCFDTSRGCAPVNPFGAGNLSPQASDFIGLPGTAFTEDSSETYLTFGTGGGLKDLPAGDVEFAIGAEYRRFEFENVFPNENLQTGDSLFFGNGINPSAGTIEVGELYAEARVPLIASMPWAEYLGLDLGLRASDYNTQTDTAWTWKFGLEWQVSGQVRLRAMRQRAIRAPGVSELFQGVNFAFTDLQYGLMHDECSASRDPVANGLAQLCVAQGIPESEIGTFEARPFPTAISFASNPNVQPEIGNTLTAGLVWESERVRGAIDYFRIEIVDALASADHVDLARICFLSRDPDSQACQTISRAPSGDIDSGLITTINSAFAISEGIDLALHIDWENPWPAVLAANSSVRLSLLATHYLQAGTQGSVLLPHLDCAGKFGAFCGLFAYQGAVPDWRATARLNYETEALTASVRWRYIGPLTNAENELRRLSNLPPANLAVPGVAAQSYVDLTLSRPIVDNFRVAFGIENLLDKGPPILGSASRDANTDTTTYDILGRRFFLRSTLKF